MCWSFAVFEKLVLLKNIKLYDKRPELIGKNFDEEVGVTLGLDLFRNVIERHVRVVVQEQSERQKNHRENVTRIRKRDRKCQVTDALHYLFIPPCLYYFQTI